MKRIGFVLFPAVLMVVLSGCANFFASLEPREITVSGSEFTLAWDPPANRHIKEGHEPDRYRLYYRSIGDGGPTDWTVLGTVAADSQPRLTVQQIMLTPGTYEFAVSTIDAIGNESEFHYSTDSDAEPRRGWFIAVTGG